MTWRDDIRLEAFRTCAGAALTGPRQFFELIDGEGREEWSQEMFGRYGLFPALGEIIADREQKLDDLNRKYRSIVQQSGKTNKAAKAVQREIDAIEKLIKADLRDLAHIASEREHSNSHPELQNIRWNISRILASSIPIIGLCYVFEQHAFVRDFGEGMVELREAVGKDLRKVEKKFQEVQNDVFEEVVPLLGAVKYKRQSFNNTFRNQLLGLRKLGLLRMSVVKRSEKNIQLHYFPGYGIKAREIHVVGTRLGKLFLNRCRQYGEQLVSGEGGKDA